MMSVSSKIPFPNSGCSFGRFFRISRSLPPSRTRRSCPSQGSTNGSSHPLVSTTTSARPRWPILTLVEVASPTMTKSGWMRFVISRGATPQSTPHALSRRRRLCPRVLLCLRGEAPCRHDHRAVAALHVGRAPAVDFSVLDLAAERVVRPLGRINHVHGVHVPVEQNRFAGPFSVNGSDDVSEPVKDSSSKPSASILSRISSAMACS